MPNPAAYISAGMESAVRELKADGVPVNVIASYRAMVEGAAVCIEFSFESVVHLTDKQELLCCFVAVSLKYMEQLGAGTEDERALADEWRKREREIVLPSVRQSKLGTRNKGREGALKRYIREITIDGAVDFDGVLAALEDHMMVDEITDTHITYSTGNTVKTVTIENARRAYNEIIK